MRQEEFSGIIKPFKEKRPLNAIGLKGLNEDR